MELNVKNVIWDLSHLYNGIDDNKIEEDIGKLKKEVSTFSSDYKGKIKDITVSNLLEAVVRFETIEQSAGKLGTFAFLNYATQSHNASAGAFMQRIHEMCSLLGRDLIFFSLEWAKLNNRRAEELLKSPEVEKYKHYLEVVRKYKPHQLSEIEEKLLAEISPVGVSSWNRLFDSIFSQMKFGPKKRSEEEVLADLYNPDRSVRKTASKEFTSGLKENLHIFTHIFNTVIADHMISDRLRNYPEWISSRNLSNEVDDGTVETLVSAVQNRYDIPNRYYHLKKKLLGQKELFDYDRYAPLTISENKVYTWGECKKIILSSFSEFSHEISDISSRFFEENWIHAPVLEGKRGGAFAHPATPDVHPYLMVNYTGNNRDIQTVAHELGHGVHQFLAGREQGFINSNTPLTTAETASVFGEMLVFQSLLARATDKNEKLSLLCNKLESIFATVFRQISMNRFEHLIHKDRRDTGELSIERFSQLWVETQGEMFGDSITLTENYEIWWSYIPHFLHSPGYVYAYAFGELLVLSLYKKYRDEGKGFVKKYITLLSSGGKESPDKLLEMFNIDLKDPDFWNEGLSIIDEMLNEAETLA